MKKAFYFLLFLIFISFSCSKAEPERPNVVYILADDLGYGEVGAFGQKIIQTPNIDALAASGMKLTDHYSGSPVCAPSRYMLLTGFHPGNAFIRGNHEWGERGDVWNYRKAIEDSTLEGQYPIPAETYTIGELFQSAGYVTGCVGKWGLGAPGSEGDPNYQGFDLFYGYNCQRQAHNLYPKHLWRNQEKVWLDNEIIVPGALLDSTLDISDPSGYEPFRQKEYAPELMLKEALQFMEGNRSSPFFLYFASPLPHLPLQAPRDDVDKYRKIIGPEKPYPGGLGYFPSQYPRATYAAMIDHLDQQVGAIVSTLKDLGLYENTLIIFSSDNGATYDVGGVDPHYFESGGPFNSGRGWGKGYVHEGGLRVPTVATWPGKIAAGTSSSYPSAFWDIFPTMADLLGKPAGDVDGLSLLPVFAGDDQPDREYLYWEFPAYGGQQAVRKNTWKAIRRDIRQGNLEIELYNLETDLREENNIAPDHPEIVQEMAGIMDREHTTSELERFRMAAIDSVANGQ